MAEVRTFDPGSGEGLQKLVREALGETVRPFEPGRDQSSEQRSQDLPAAGAADLSADDTETISFSW